VDGIAIGCFLITYEWSDWRNGTVWWLQSVYVMPAHRQQGVFKKMYDHIIGSISGDPAVTGLRLYVDKSNSRAQNVYRSLGMNGDHYTVFEWMKK
jgi:ribosomal protein S18 acetylase RimI-like enzyme